MVRAHRADIDSLQSTYTAVIFDLHPREIANSIRHAQSIHLFELCPSKCLRNNDILFFNAGGDSVLL